MSEIDCPVGVACIAGYPVHPADRMHPFRKIGEVLTVQVPFEPCVAGLPGPPFGQGFSEPEATPGGMQPALILRKATDPPGPFVILSVPAERPVDLVDKPQDKIPPRFVPGAVIQPEVVAHGKSVSPEIPLLRGRRGIETGNLCESDHDLPGPGRTPSSPCH